MARKSSTQLNYSRIFLTILVIAALGGGFIYLTGHKPEKIEAGSDFPIDDYMTRSSSLRDNVYTLSGKVENRDVHSKGEIITLLVNAGKGKSERLPVIVPHQKASINIEREQSYNFTVKVGSMGQSKGLLIAESIANQ